jgi:hypothetical protein
MMIFFNDPVPVASPAKPAIRRAVTMRERVGVSHLTGAIAALMILPLFALHKPV